MVAFGAALWIRVALVGGATAPAEPARLSPTAIVIVAKIARMSPPMMVTMLAL